MSKSIDSGFEEAHNQTVGKLLQACGWPGLHCLTRMSQVFPNIHVARQEASLSRDRGAVLHADPVPLDFHELVHELRQPLSVIESLAYYLELTSSDEKVCTHLERIQAMVLEANRILERTYISQDGVPLEAAAC